MNILAGKVALVTGGTRGIGRAIVIELAKEDCDVAFTYSENVAKAEEVTQEVQKMNKKVHAFKSSAKEFLSAQDVVNNVIKEFGRIDILVNNAGINRDTVIWKMTETDWDDVIDTNLKGYFNYIRAVVSHMRENKKGRIINITSINGLRGKFGQANYTASKAGLIGLTKTCARELGKFGITANAVAPGLIETDMMKGAPPDVREKALVEIVLGKIGQPEDVAALVTFLASDRANHITGEVIKVDGGQYI